MKTCHVRNHTKLRAIFTGGFLLRMLTIFNAYAVMKVRISISLSSHFPPPFLLAFPVWLSWVFWWCVTILLSESSVSVTWLSELTLYTSVWTESTMNRLMARLAVIDPGHDGHHAELIGFLSSINSISILSHAQTSCFHFSSIYSVSSPYFSLVLS